MRHDTWLIIWGFQFIIASGQAHKYLTVKIKLVNAVSSAVFVKIALESSKTRQRFKVFYTIT